MRARRGVRAAMTTDVIGEGDCGAGGRVVMIDNAEMSSTAGERTRRRKRVACVVEIGRFIPATGMVAVIVAMLVVAVLDVVGCGGRDRKKQRKGRGGREQTASWWSRTNLLSGSRGPPAKCLGDYLNLLARGPERPTLQTNANREIEPNLSLSLPNRCWLSDALESLSKEFCGECRTLSSNSRHRLGSCETIIHPNLCNSLHALHSSSPNLWC